MGSRPSDQDMELEGIGKTIEQGKGAAAPRQGAAALILRSVFAGQFFIHIENKLGWNIINDEIRSLSAAGVQEGDSVHDPEEINIPSI